MLAVMLDGSSLAHAAFDCSESHGGWRVDSSDSWTGTDKLAHMAASAPFGALGAYVTRDTAHPVAYGTLIGTAPGFAKEVIDGTCRTDGFSLKDLSPPIRSVRSSARRSRTGPIMCQRDTHSMTLGVRYSSRF